jgi:hypothetical protein
MAPRRSRMHANADGHTLCSRQHLFLNTCNPWGSTTVRVLY